MINELAIIPTAEIIPVHSRPHPMSMEVFHAEFPAGSTIAEILGPEAKSCRVEIGGMTIPEEWWIHVRPKPGYAVIITRFPQGGASAKSILRIVAFAALAVGVALISGGAGSTILTAIGDFINVPTQVVAGLLAASVGVVGSLVINALIPPQNPSASVAAIASGSSTQLLNAITGTGNQVNRYGAIPCAVGTVLYYPPYAALPYTELSGDDQYLRCLFDLGYGDPDPSEMKIGNTDIASYTDVETEIGISPGLFSQDVTETAAGDDFATDGVTATKTSSASTDELSIDLMFASGLFALDSNGNTIAVTCVVKIEFAPTGTSAWTPVTSTTSGFTCSSPAASPAGDGTLHVLPRTKKDGRVTKASEPVSRKTKDHYKAVLHRLAECSMRWGLVDVQRNPLGLVEVRTGARRKRVPTIISFEQYRQLLERKELGMHVRVMVQLAMCLGLRASEILGLRWEDVDLLGGTIRIQRSAVGKYQDETKTESSTDTLPLHEQLVTVLMGWRQTAPVIGGWVFGSPVTGRPYHRDSLHKDYLTPAALKIGLTRLGWHDFRHTYRAMLRDLGLPLEVQQKLMRHASITMTAHYGNSGMDETKREANRQLVEYVTQTQNGSTRVV